MARWRAALWLIAAVVYFIAPWDLDFIPVVGRLDDLFFLALAGYYFWKQPQSAGGNARRRPAAEPAPDSPGRRGARGEADPYRLFGVSEHDDVETIKKAYRELIAKYHPDRVHHLGEEFREMAAARTAAINDAYETIKKARGFS
jgi:DnaJ-domain-containing protein 1